MAKEGSWEAAFFGDYHIHSSFSSDADASLYDISTCSVKKGLKEIGIADHISFFPQDPNYILFKDYESYKKEIELVRCDFKPHLSIWWGVEIDYYYEKELEIINFLNMYDFDYCLVSVHYVDGFSLMEEKFYREYSPEKGVKKYIEILQRALNAVPSGMLSAAAHIDWIKRGWKKYWGFYPYDPDFLLRQGLGNVLQLIVRRGVFLEINSSGYRRHLGEPFPGQEILACYKEVGGKYCILGSDAHHKEEVAADFLKIRPMVRYLGLELVSLGQIIKKYKNKKQEGWL